MLNSPIRLPLGGVIADIDGTLREGFTAGEREGELLPHAYELITHLIEHKIPLVLATNQRGMHYHAFQEELQRLQGWEGRSWPSGLDIVQKLVEMYQRLGSPHIPVVIAVYASALPELLGRSQYDDEVFQRAEDGARVMESALRRAQIRAHVSANPNWSKPRPGMMFMAKDLMEYGTAEDAQWKGIPNERILCIGDMHEGNPNVASHSDQQAAEAAHMQFFPAERIGELLDIENFSRTASKPRILLTCQHCSTQIVTPTDTTIPVRCPHCRRDGEDMILKEVYR